MGWTKTGRAFAVDGTAAWAQSHAGLPTPLLIDDDRLRVFFGTRGADNRSRIGALEMSPQDGAVRNADAQPVLDLGPPGAFDENGVIPASVVWIGDECRLYYIGYRPADDDAPYVQAIGVAVSHDGGRTFQRTMDGPMLPPRATESLVTSPCVVRDGEQWRMWYVSGTGWVKNSGLLDPVYDIKHATSTDGLRWTHDDVTCIVPATPDEAIGRACVTGGPGAWEMWYSRRATTGFRTDQQASYRIGYARSRDGRHWDRHDDEAGIDVSATGWDAEMIAYPAIYEHRGLRHLLYNGNGFGTSGFGHAVWR